MKYAEPILKFAMEIFKGFSPVMQFVFFVIVLALLFFIYAIINSKTFRDSSIKSLLIRYVRDNLSAQELFFKSAYYESAIANVRFCEYNKTKLFQLLLSAKIESSISITKAWLTENDFNKMSDAELCDTFYCNINKTLKEGKGNIKKRYISEFGELRGKKFFNHVYHSKDGFRRINSPNIKFIYRNIDNIAVSRTLSTNRKVAFYLKQIEIALDLDIMDCEEAFMGFNGELRRIEAIND